ncbi:efflux RND transporter periplasmic adaptor subunit [Candidatus Gottesmanbacteria bacterium]|nr:efflux RND transporter periplasmic adaptor subunit [Candidatus Gottesmanbacteria bacterium]
MKILSFINAKFIAMKEWFFKSSLLVKVIVILAITALGWFFLPKLQAKVSKPSQFKTAKIKKGTIVSSVSSSGRVLSANIFNITTNASGIVKNVYVKDGEQIISGQKIAEIKLDTQGQQKNTQAWSNYLTAKNIVDAANTALFTLQSDMLSKWKIYMDLAQSSTYQNSDGSPKTDARTLPQFYSPYDDWLSTEGKYKNQQGVIDQTKASLNNAWISYQLTSPIISAPTSGTIGNIGLIEGMEVGSQVGTSTTDQTINLRVAVIQNEANPILSVNLTEIDVPKVKIGQKATVTIDSLPDKIFTGKVVTVDRIGTISNNVTSYPATIQLDSTSFDILPNMAVSASIIIETKRNVLVAPSAAIQNHGGESFVKVLKDGHQEQVAIKIGITSDTDTEIISGLSEADEVITGTITSSQTQQKTGGSVFTGGFGGGAFRPGGFGGGQRR